MGTSVRFRVLAPVSDFVFNCNKCGRTIATGEAAIQIVDTESKQEGSVMLLLAQKKVTCCEETRELPELFPTAIEALVMISDIEKCLEQGDDPPYIVAWSFTT